MGFRLIDHDGCVRLLVTKEVGRLGFLNHGQPDILPVNYAMDGDAWDWQLRRSNVRLPDVPAPTGPSAKAYMKRRATRMAGQAM